jgi:hypothetical protein
MNDLIQTSKAGFGSISEGRKRGRYRSWSFQSPLNDVTKLRWHSSLERKAYLLVLGAAFLFISLAFAEDIALPLSSGFVSH